MKSFTDRVVVVTGASSGIGRAIALALASEKPRLVLAGRDRGRLEDAEHGCRRQGAEVVSVAGDLTHPNDARRLIHHATEAFGAIDALVNNAGATMWARFDEIEDLSLFEQLLRINYLSSVYCTRHALPWLLKSRGRIVAVASVAGLTGVPMRTAYSASKHAMIGFFESLRVELAGSGVSVTIAAPDFVRSDTHRRALGPNGTALGYDPMAASDIQSAESCAQMVIGAMRKRKRLMITSARGRVGRWVRLLAPRLIDRLAAHAIERRK